MKKRDVWTSLAIIAALAGALYLYTLANSLVEGSIEIDAGNANATLHLHSSLFGRVRLIARSEPTQVNTRVLKPRFLTISKRQDNQIHLLNSRGPWGDISRIRIKNNDKIELRLGPPLLIKPSVSKSNRYVTIGFSIIGQVGESYEIPIGATVPKVKIIDEQGNALATGSFAYG